MLACEIEWDARPDWVLEDSLKLMVCRADTRLIVSTACGKPEGRDDLFTRMQEAERRCSGGPFLAVAMPEQAGGLFPFAGG